jgi:hypothetical protein
LRAATKIWCDNNNNRAVKFSQPFRGPRSDEITLAPWQDGWLNDTLWRSKLSQAFCAQVLGIELEKSLSDP